MLQAMVPEQQSVASWYLEASLHHQLQHILEVPKTRKKRLVKAESGDGTYDLLVGTCLGLMSAFLKAANQSSQGAASKLCGPVNSTGSWSFSNSFIVVAAERYLAVSRRMTVCLLKLGSSRSS